MNSSTHDTEFDYIVVGAGSAGCVLANRLSASPNVSVLLLEAGKDAEPFWVRTPAGVGNLFFNERLNWKFFTEPEANLGDRQVYWPRGKILGGSSSINGMVYVRGFASDYDRWQAQGNPGWAWSDVLPYFKRAEHNDYGASESRGVGGPLHVSFPHRQHPTTEAFVRAGAAVGLTRHDDVVAGGDAEGVGYLQHTIGEGRRWSSAHAYVRPVRQRTNLAIESEAVVTRLHLDGRCVVGVEYIRRGQSRTIRARREVILSAGAIGSPHLLMLSGIGPPDHLQEMGVRVRHALPGVGCNLQDHLAINACYEVRKDASLNAALSGWHKYLNGVDYLLHRRGPLAIGASHAVAFVCSSTSIKVPDIQLSFRPLSFAFDSKNKLRMHTFAGVQFASAMLRPRSRGQILLRSPNPFDAPVIHANYLTDPDDMRVMVATLEWTRRLAATAPLADMVVREYLPGENVRSASEVVEFIRRSSQTLFHPAGTCKMGSDSLAVVDERLRVRGIENLRVVDASVMPTIVSGNTNAPTIMIAEKASDMILEDARS
ncbi:GMC family oxidoreductase [Cupriavidus basilensis]|uniref:Choline dehydrogenase n=1 Tax=Cupriavidus basilensis TaxID=68895 RepID=A0A0C4YNZ5_9BURK|nr:GMC family oxidoreductase N-terminal domain-containing protein [Cupriavidus basilensis]AJG22326.1 Choline dehydrogenase [Cupriavidus basilensis]